MLSSIPLQIIHRLDPADWPAPDDRAMAIFCPFLAGLPAEHALSIAMLPIHDANGLTIDAIDQSDWWPDHGWACVMPCDPFRPADRLLQALARGGVRRICLYPVAELIDPAMHQTLGSFGLADESVLKLEQAAAAMDIACASPPLAAWTAALVNPVAALPS